MVSGQLVLVTELKTPPPVESLATTSRSFAAAMLAPAGSPLTSNRRNACLALDPPPTARMVGHGCAPFVRKATIPEGKRLSIVKQGTADQYDAAIQPMWAERCKTIDTGW